jgi:tRNA(Arg) A34 adenosine deaminase TadA
MLNDAIELARSNPTDLPKMAAIIVKRKKIIATGMNSRKTHPLQAKFGENPFKICQHAEIAAIINALRNYDEEELRGAQIYVARVAKNGSATLAKPCKGCSEALAVYGIEGVHYTE